MKLPRLLAISPGDGRSLHKWLAPLIAAGLPGLILREPTLSEEELLRALDPIRKAIPFLALHHRTPGASRLAVSHGLPLHVSASYPPTEALHGRSTHSGEELDRAFQHGARYALLSPVWKPCSKPDDDRTTIGLDQFLQLRESRPVFALGGVTPERFRQLAKHGVGAAILGDLFGRESPNAAAARLLEYLA